MVEIGIPAGDVFVGASVPDLVLLIEALAVAAFLQQECADGSVRMGHGDRLVFLRADQAQARVRTHPRHVERPGAPIRQGHTGQEIGMRPVEPALIEIGVDGSVSVTPGARLRRARARRDGGNELRCTTVSKVDPPPIAGLNAREPVRSVVGVVNGVAIHVGNAGCKQHEALAGKVRIAIRGFGPERFGIDRYKPVEPVLVASRRVAEETLPAILGSDASKPPAFDRHPGRARGPLRAGR